MNDNGALAQRAMQGDQAAFAQLYYNHTDELKRYIIKLGAKEQDAEDLVSEAFMEAYTHISDLREPQYFSTWLHTIAKNKFLAMTRRDSRLQRVSFATEEQPNDEVDQAAFAGCDEADDSLLLPDDYADSEDVKRLLAETIDGMKDEQRSVLYLFYYNDLTVRQISAQTGVSEGTVKSRLFAARAQLKRKLEQLQRQGVVLAAVPFPMLFAACNMSEKLKKAAEAWRWQAPEQGLPLPRRAPASA